MSGCPRYLPNMTELSEFVAEQDRVWPDVLAELRSGRKTSHWIWFVFPQLADLGRSERARRFGLAGLDEARAYQAHPVLGARLIEAASLVLDHRGTPPEDILGSLDALKLRSSMTLFEAVPQAPPVYARVLNEMYAGERCPVTERFLGA